MHHYIYLSDSGSCDGRDGGGDAWVNCPLLNKQNKIIYNIAINRKTLQE